MKNVLHYKGYSARPEYSAEDQIFMGKFWELMIWLIISVLRGKAQPFSRFLLSLLIYVLFVKDF